MNFRETIPIVIASDNHYAVLIAALIKSVEINHKSNELLLFTIIDDGISKTNKLKLQKSIDPSMTSLHWIKSSDVIPSDIKIPVDKSTFPFTAYFRLFAPYLLELEFKKIIYMDVDMIVYNDISNLYHIDIGDNIVGAVQDYMLTVSFSSGGIPNYKELGIPPETKYFNSGLLLINSKKWIKENIVNNVIECLTTNKKHVIYPDQYGLNVVLRDKWFEIDRVWNGSPLFDDPPNPSIVHFLDIKPIFKSCFAKEKHKKEFFRLLSMTAFKDFKPINDYQRLLKKIITRVKKIIYNIISNSF